MDVVTFHRMEEIIKFMEENSYMDLEEEDENGILYTTNDNGDKMREEPGIEDIVHAKSLVIELKEMGFKSEIEPIDEYVYLTIYPDV